MQQITNIGSITGDSSGDCQALKSYAGYLLLKNDDQNHTLAIDKKVEGQIKRNYLDYLNHYRQATALKLSPEEEFSFSKVFFKEKIRRNFFETLESIKSRICGKI